MPSFERVSQAIDVNPAVNELYNNSHLFGQINIRREQPTSPHVEMRDIWLRYKPLDEMIASGDYSALCDEHMPQWLQDLPECKKICRQVLRIVNGDILGGVFITKLPPGGKIKPHIDGGWHAAFYDKYFVPLQNKEGAVFGFEDGNINALEGDVWKFDNSITHWVTNNSDSERIAMIVCIRGGE